MQNRKTDELKPSHAAGQLQHWQAFVRIALEAEGSSDAAQRVLGRLLEVTRLCCTSLTVFETNHNQSIVLASLQKISAQPEPLISATLLLEHLSRPVGRLEISKQAEQDFDPQDLVIAHQAAEALAITLPGILQRENLDRRLEALEQECEADHSAARELDTFAHFVSHDLRASLRGMDGYSAALIADYSEKLDELGQAYLQYIRDSSRIMAEQIDRLLRYTRALRQELHIGPVDLSALATEITRQLQASAPERSVNFVIQPDLVVQADPVLINSMLRHLLENAWKFTAQHASAQIEFGATLQDGQTVYYIRDDGAGFNMAYRDKLFQPGQRLHGAHEFGGTGMGLATVQRILRRHNGHAWAEGAPEKGATFYFSF